MKTAAESSVALNCLTNSSQSLRFSLCRNYELMNDTEDLTNQFVEVVRANYDVHRGYSLLSILQLHICDSC